MENLNNICLICFSYKRDLQHLSSKTDDEVTYLDKLTVAIPEMNCDLLNEQRSICRQCCNNIDICYKFRKKCLKSKALLINYASQHASENESNKNDNVNSCVEDSTVASAESTADTGEENQRSDENIENIVIKTEIPDEEDREEYTYMHLDKVKTEIDFDDKSTNEQGENSTALLGSVMDNSSQGAAVAGPLLIPPFIPPLMKNRKDLFQLSSEVIHRLRRREGPTKAVRKRCRECYQTLKREFGKKVADGRTKKVNTYCVHCAGQPTLCLECFNNIH